MKTKNKLLINSLGMDSFISLAHDTPIARDIRPSIHVSSIIFLMICSYASIPFLLALVHDTFAGWSECDVAVRVAEEETNLRRADVSGGAFDIDVGVAGLAFDPFSCGPLADAPGRFVGRAGSPSVAVVSSAP